MSFKKIILNLKEDTVETRYITRSLGPGHIVCYIRYFVIHVSVVNKQYENEVNYFIGTGDISLLYQISLYRGSTVILYLAL